MPTRNFKTPGAPGFISGLKDIPEGDAMTDPTVGQGGTFAFGSGPPAPQAPGGFGAPPDGGGFNFNMG